MQTAALAGRETFIASRIAQPAAAQASAYSAYQIIRRNGAVVSFEPSKIAVALMKAFLAVHGTQGAALGLQKDCHRLHCPTLIG